MHRSGNHVTVRYGFSGRVLLGLPRGLVKTAIATDSNVFITDSKREKVSSDQLRVDVTVAVENAIGYFSPLRSVSFGIC